MLTSLLGSFVPPRMGVHGVRALAPTDLSAHTRRGKGPARQRPAPALSLNDQMCDHGNYESVWSTWTLLVSELILLCRRCGAVLAASPHPQATTPWLLRTLR